MAYIYTMAYNPFKIIQRINKISELNTVKPEKTVSPRYSLYWNCLNQDFQDFQNFQDIEIPKWMVFNPENPGNPENPDSDKKLNKLPPTISTTNFGAKRIKHRQTGKIRFFS